jgi:hypothetical protein
MSTGKPGFLPNALRLGVKPSGYAWRNSFAMFLLLFAAGVGSDDDGSVNLLKKGRSCS